MEVEQDDDVGIVLDAVESRGEFGPDLDRAQRALEKAARSEGRGRQVGRLFEARADDADGLEPEPALHFAT
ncbi:MAG: hypothetical protein MZW92_62030 [Comamonadaceae bacterium]|nr:hypothetical protein [Comamonadaceae bacterium]